MDGEILKHQDNSHQDILRLNKFYVLSVPLTQRTPKSIVKHGVFHAKQVGDWADLQDDAPVMRISGFKSTKLSQNSEFHGRLVYEDLQEPDQTRRDSSPSAPRTATAPGFERSCGSRQT